MLAACLSKWYIQPFMAAIASHSLIQYYEETGLDKTNIYNMVKYVAGLAMGQRARLRNAERPLVSEL